MSLCARLMFSDQSFRFRVERNYLPMKRGYRNITYRSSPRRDSVGSSATAANADGKYRGGEHGGRHNARSQYYQSDKARSRSHYRTTARVRSRSTGRRESNDGEERSSRRSRHDSVRIDRKDDASLNSYQRNVSQQQRLSNRSRYETRRKLSAPDERRREHQGDWRQTRHRSCSFDSKNGRRDSAVEPGKSGRARSGINDKVLTGHHTSGENESRPRSGARLTSPERNAGSIQLVTSDVSSRVRNEMKISNVARCVDELGKYTKCQRSLVHFYIVS